jgi:hypothetical protein
MFRVGVYPTLIREISGRDESIQSCFDDNGNTIIRKDVFNALVRQGILTVMKVDDEVLLNYEKMTPAIDDKLMEDYIEPKIVTYPAVIVDMTQETWRDDIPTSFCFTKTGGLPEETLKMIIAAQMRSNRQNLDANTEKKVNYLYVISSFDEYARLSDIRQRKK